MKKSQRGRRLFHIERLLYFFDFFFSPTDICRVQNQGKSQLYIKYFQVLALECLHLTQTDHLIFDMDEPCLVGKVIIAIHSRVTLM